jgi:hypothetical protein
MPKKYKSKLIAQVVKDAEVMFKAKVITFESQFGNPRNLTEPGGMCSCCGAGPRVTDEHDWWLVLRAGLCDSDGVFYSMLCGGTSGDGCLEEIRHQNAKRKPTFRDEAASIIALLNGDDVDGMQSEFEDADQLGMLDIGDE